MRGEDIQCSITRLEVVPVKPSRVTNSSSLGVSNFGTTKNKNRTVSSRTITQRLT
jgi:DMSO/TMAO reductase YedYZ molybdopterin-dependent catalytic subunit